MSYEKPEGMVILSPNLSQEQRTKWILALKETLGGDPLLVNQKMLWSEGPPGFTVIYGTDEGWRIAWKKYNGETKQQQDKWTLTLPVTMVNTMKAGAVDLRARRET